jgi:3-methyladenine DNA glycosylase/8-oxoguanine DNA glycosylase
VALLPIPQPFDFELSTERFRAFGPDPANLWHEDGLLRVVGGREVRIEQAPGGVDVEPLDDETAPVVLKLLGTEFDLDAFEAWAAEQPVLDELVPKLRGFRPPVAPDPFETLVTSITAQQVSLFAAFAIRSRMIHAFGERAGEAYAFPTAERLADATEEEIVAVGFSRRKAEYVLGLARANLDFGRIAGLPDDGVKAELTAIRGLGEWTADWFLGRHLARPRAWPAGDLALRKAVAAFYADGSDLSIDEVRAMGAQFEPFQNLTAHYLLTGARTVAAA